MGTGIPHPAAKQDDRCFQQGLPASVRSVFEFCQEPGKLFRVKRLNNGKLLE